MAARDIGNLKRGGFAHPALALMVLALSPCIGNSQDAQAGMRKAGACATCHGPQGISQTPDAPHLAGQPAIYLAEQLKAYRGGKRSHEVMGVIAKNLSDADIADLAAWFASIEIKAEPKK